MNDILFLAVVGIVFYVVYCLVSKQPIIPTKKSKEKSNQRKKAATSQMNEQHKKEILEEVEAVPFEEFFPEILDIRDGIIIQDDYWYSMMAQVLPVNYYLRDEDEQEKIDRSLESWFAKLDNTLVRVYLQNRFIDLTEDIERLQKTMELQDDLNEAAREYGKYMLEDLRRFQMESPRYEQKIFLVFDYKVNINDLRIDEGEDLEEKAFDKAKNELLRRYKTANQMLFKAENELSLLNTSDIVEVSYHQFNRRKARKIRYKNIEQEEMMSVYLTADQNPEHIANVKEEIDDVLKKQNEGNPRESSTSKEEQETKEKVG